MTFRETLKTHLQAIQNRDRNAFAATVSPSEFTLVTSRGNLITSSDEFLRLHEEWFALPGWRLDAKVQRVHESAEMGVAVIRLDYRDRDSQGKDFQETSYLTLVFQNQDDRWLLIFDQNTPVRGEP